MDLLYCSFFSFLALLYLSQCLSWSSLLKLNLFILFLGINLAHCMIVVECIFLCFIFDNIFISRFFVIYTQVFDYLFNLGLLSILLFSCVSYFIKGLFGSWIGNGIEMGMWLKMEEWSEIGNKNLIWLEGLFIGNGKSRERIAIKLHLYPYNKQLLFL